MIPRHRARIYERLSAKGEESVSIENQTAACKAEAIKRGYLVEPADIFSDGRGHQSGLDSKRPAYCALKTSLSSLKSGDAVFVRDTTRLSRDIAEWQAWRSRRFKGWRKRIKS